MVGFARLCEFAGGSFCRKSILDPHMGLDQKPGLHIEITDICGILWDYLLTMLVYLGMIVSAIWNYSPTCFLPACFLQDGFHSQHHSESHYLSLGFDSRLAISIPCKNAFPYHSISNLSPSSPWSLMNPQNSWSTNRYLSIFSSCPPSSAITNITKLVTILQYDY